jgi:UDP-galactopyranose mutase
MVRVLIVGGGFAGLCAAHVLQGRGWDVTLVETAPFLGGGLRTFEWGGHPFTYGPRHFLTERQDWFEFLNAIVPMRLIGKDHVSLSYVEKDQDFYYWPPHIGDVERMPEREEILEQVKNAPGVANAKNFEDFWLGSLGELLYSKYAKTYTAKMWDVKSCAEIDGFDWGGFDEETKPATILKLRGGNVASWSSDRITSAFPLARNSYNDYFDQAVKEANVKLSTRIEEFDVPHYRVKIAGEWHTYDIMINTIYPEVFMSNIYGPLRWMGRDFIKLVLPVEHVLPHNVFFLYFTNSEQVTRMVEYKKFYQNKSPSSLIAIEIPSKSNKLYPYPMRKDIETAEKYFQAMPRNVFTLGRAGSYRYIDVDDIIGQCLDLKTNI